MTYSDLQTYERWNKKSKEKIQKEFRKNVLEKRWFL